MSDYNAFIGFAQGDKYYGIKYTRYTPLFEIRENAAGQSNVIQPFKDSPSVALNIPASKTPIPVGVFNSLGNYIDYINETYRTVSHFRDVMRNLNSSAAYYKGLTSYTGHGGLSFTHDDFTIPTSYYQKCVTESKSLSTYATPLNQQAEVILNILKEMDQIGIAIENEVKTRAYEKDKLMQLYQWIERFAVLYDTWDRKKEELYSNVRAVYDSYPHSTPSNSWTISGKVLHVLTDLDREGLFKAKSFYKTGEPKTISTDQIDATLREVISNEFTNMKGIEKYGRNHGLCPYTPYEDLPVTSRSLSEDFRNLKSAKKNDNGYNHPYHGMVYLYNDIVEDHNKFAELAKVPLLKTVKQPELFFVAYPEPESDPSNDFPLVKETPGQSAPDKPKQQGQDVPSAEKDNRPTKKKTQTVEQANTTVVIHDTVYIERRDTIWMATPPDDLRSMEGYATNNMVLLLDVSGSMNSPEKLPLLKESVLNMLSMMRKQDEIAIVIFSGKSKVLLNPSSFKDGDKIRKAIESLGSSGKTDGNAGLKLAYKVADDNYIRGGNNRIILATDGEFPVSEETTAMIRKFSNEDIYLTIFNFGKGMGSSRALQNLATLGKGNYVPITKANVELGLIREAKGGKQLGR
jgi:Mg-chelatase subunit ChlD